MDTTETQLRTRSGPLMPRQGGKWETDLREKTINIGKLELICYLELIGYKLK